MLLFPNSLKTVPNPQSAPIAATKCSEATSEMRPEID